MWFAQQCPNKKYSKITFYVSLPGYCLNKVTKHKTINERKMLFLLLSIDLIHLYGCFIQFMTVIVDFIDQLSFIISILIFLL